MISPVSAILRVPDELKLNRGCRQWPDRMQFPEHKALPGFGGTGRGLPGYVLMSNDLKDLAPNTARDQAPSVKKASHGDARLVRCEVCGQVFNARDVGDLVHHSLMGPGHKQLPH